MSIQLITSQKEIDRLFEKIAEIIYDRIVYNLSYLGEQCIVRIRNRSGDESWFDQTGNLRSSIGYAIYSYGKKLIESTFRQIKNGREGTAKGKKMIEDLANQYSDTYALVVIAAMDYADYVESIDSKDVLASTEIYAKKEVYKYLQKAKHEAEQEIDKLVATLL